LEPDWVFLVSQTSVLPLGSKRTTWKRDTATSIAKHASIPI
jgi:hypothetical protein